MAGAVTFETLTDVGRGRKQNEDSRGEIEAANGQLVIVCDGMGGHSAGDVASRLAVDAISQIFKNSPADDPGERLKAGFLVANQRILAHQEKEGIESMGTTAVAAFVRNGKAWIAHVGDSRCYHLRDTAIAWKTADHTRVQKMIDRGILTPEQAKTHEDANVVTRALGFTKGEDAPEPDITTRDVQDGDLLLLCSDGLYDLVKDDEIVDIGSEPALDGSVRELVDLANRRGGHDNITVTILRQGAAKARKGVKRRTDLDEGTTEAPRSKTKPPGSASASDVAKAQAEAHAAREAAERSKRALILVVAGFALVGIAAAVFFMTRGNGDEPVPVTKHDAGAGSAIAPMVDDAGAGSAAPADATVAGSGSQTHTTGSNTGGTGAKNRKDAGVAATPTADGGAAQVPTGNGTGNTPAPGPDAGTGTTTTNTPPNPNNTLGGGAQDLGGPKKAKIDAGVAPANPGAGTQKTPPATPAPSGATPAPTGGATAAPTGGAAPATGGAGTKSPTTGGATTKGSASK